MPGNIKRILLMSADSAPGTYRSSQWGSHPIGLMYIAAAVRKALPETEVRIYQTLTQPDYKQDLKALLDDFQPDLIGIRAISFYQEAFSELVDIVRKTLPDRLIVGGGPHVSTSYEKLLEIGEIDMAVLGEGEDTFVELIKVLNSNQHQLPTGLYGTAVLRDGKAYVNPERARILNLDELAWPAYDLIDLDAYKKIRNMSSLSVPNPGYIEASRGCPYKCFYCHIALEKLLRQRSTESVVAEMKHLHHTYGIEYFIFLDDIFNLPQRRAKETLKLIAKELPNVRLSFQNGLRADQVDDELLDLLEAAGTIQVTFAIETVTPRLQKFSGKELRLDQACRTIEKASHRFITTCCFMMGFPGETYEEAEQTIRYAASLTHVFDPPMSVTRVYRNSQLWNYLNPTKEQGRLIDLQTRSSAQTTLFNYSAKEQFYGDFFSDDVVPLKSEQIAELHALWLREVQFNPQRLCNSYEILRRFLDYDAAVASYGTLLNDPNYTAAKLETTLKFARQQVAKQKQAEAQQVITV